MNVIAKSPVLKFSKLSPNVGVEVTGIDLTQPVSEETRQQLIVSALSISTSQEQNVLQLLR